MIVCFGDENVSGESLTTTARNRARAISEKQAVDARRQAYRSLSGVLKETPQCRE